MDSTTCVTIIVSPSVVTELGVDLMEVVHFPSLVSANTPSLKANPQLCISYLTSWRSQESMERKPQCWRRDFVAAMGVST